jgi:GTP cyclohydrolase II
MKERTHQRWIFSLRRVVSTQLSTRWGMFHALGFEREVVNGIGRIDTALTFALGNLTEGAPLLRIHSQCLIGEILGPLGCDCGGQFEIAMQAIAKEGRGLLIYEYEESRGIGLMAKLRAYSLQETGRDTVQADHAFGFGADCRDFSVSADILRHLGISRVRLLSHNPNKTRALLNSGISVVDRISCEALVNSHSLPHLERPVGQGGR